MSHSPKEPILAKTLRVHNLAKELGVPSKAIVAKCNDEGVPGIENHMSVVKIGLAVTIREWFADGHAEEDPNETTAVETADKVDLSTVRAKAKRKPRTSSGKAKAGKKTDDAADTPAKTDKTTEKSTTASEESADTHTAARKRPKVVSREPEKPEVVESSASESIEQAPADAAAVEASDQTSQADSIAEGVSVDNQASGQPAETLAADQVGQAPEADASQDTQTPEATEPDPAIGPVGKVNVPVKPKVVKPAGEQLAKPVQAKLRGPKVVRVEKPEPVATPRPKRQGGGGPNGGGGGGGGGRQQQDDMNLPTGEAPGFTRSRGPARGRGAGGPMSLEEMGEAPRGKGGGNRKRSGGMNTRRGRSADALPTGPTQFSQADMEELDARLKGASGFLKQRRRDMRKRGSSAGPAQSAVETGGKVEVTEPLTIKTLSADTGIKTADIIKYLFTQKNVMATINSAIDTESAMEIAMEYDIELEVKELQTAQEKVEEAFAQQDEIDVQPRPPIVTILGHVDHGKTSLLDKIRKADVAAHEAGGITQHVGAYRVTIEGSDGKPKTVVFQDTPGHEAFTQMRSRGAQMTDLVVLVCAADDGVMPQTIESINHAQAAGVPLLVALNKIDVPSATPENIQRIYGQLAEHGLNPVEWGGETEIIKTSAETGEGITELLETLDYQAELLELKADYGGKARGTVIEAEMQAGRGVVARVMVQQGQIAVGDFINIGRAYGRVREMTNDRGLAIKDAGPATPLELSGIDSVPDAGDKFYVTQSLKQAEDIANQFRETERQRQLASQTKVTLDNFAATLKAGQVNLLRVVLKADVQGSVETIKAQLEEVGNDEVAVRVLHSAVGGITESDVLLADASDAIVIGFQVGLTPAVREIADERKVDVRQYRVIYDLIDDIKNALEGMLAPETSETEIGRADVKEVFKISKVGNIAGCLVTEGAMRNDAYIRVIRDGVVVTDHRKFASLRRVKNEAKEVAIGTECGIHVEGFNDVKAGDEIIAYTIEEIARTLA